jgi:uncharacterized protein
MLKRVDSKGLRIAIFYAVALAFSFLTRFVWRSADLAAASGDALGLAWHLLGALGPFLGAILVWALFRPERRIDFGGSFPAMGVAMLLVPAVVMAVLGIANRHAIEPHLFGAWLGLWIALYALLEETGWRGYLQGEFGDRPALLRYAIVGLFWFAWHLSFLDGGNPGSQLASLGFIVLASIGIGFVADRTRSILAAAAFHVIGNILITTAIFRELVPAQHSRLLIVSICVVVWLVMLRLWRIRDLRRERAADAPVPQPK